LGKTKKSKAPQRNEHSEPQANKNSFIKENKRSPTMRKKTTKSLCLLLAILLMLTACTAATIETTPTPVVTPTPTVTETPTVTPVENLPTSVRDLREALLANDERLALAQYDTRYLFEQSYFPMSVFMYEAELIDELLSVDLDAMWDHTLDFWEFAVADIIFRELSALTNTPPHSDEELLEFADDFGLGNEHIADITIAEIDADTRAFIIELLDMELPWLSTYLGVAYIST